MRPCSVKARCLNTNGGVYLQTCIARSMQPNERACKCSNKVGSTTCFNMFELLFTPPARQFVVPSYEEQIVG